MSTQEELLDRGLPKWPALSVRGKKVTDEQAREIIMKTDSVFDYISTNDEDWERQLVRAMGLEWKHEGYPHYDWDELEKVGKGFGHLSLEFLANHRVASAYVGGPHGWCDWSGNIFCNDYNIGKWPSVKYVLEEWKKIAEMFPYLDLRCQLFDGEQCEEDTHPVVEYIVKKGEVQLVEPNGILEVHDTDTMGQMMNLLTNPVRERGCTIEMFKLALEQVGGMELGGTK